MPQRVMGKPKQQKHKINKYFEEKLKGRVSIYTYLASNSGASGHVAAEKHFKEHNEYDNRNQPKHDEDPGSCASLVEKEEPGEDVKVSKKGEKAAAPPVHTVREERRGLSLRVEGEMSKVTQTDLRDQKNHDEQPSDLVDTVKVSLSLHHADEVHDDCKSCHRQEEHEHSPPSMNIKPPLS